MAKLLGDNLAHFSFPINKWEEDKDGNLVVTGVVTDGSVDSDRQVVEPGFSAKALTEWMESGPNLRVMHSASLYPAGRGLQVELGDNAHELKALVVEDTAKKLVRNKVLRAYSVGIANPVIKRDPTGKAPGGVITGGTLAEVSLVDRPANKNCQLVLAKSADLDIPWTCGDLAAALATAEAEATKAAKPNDGGDTPDPLEADPGTDSHAEDEEVPDAEDSAVDGNDTDDQDDGDATKSYDAARARWLAAEPSLAGAPDSGTTFLAKRAEWQRWHADGEAQGLDGTAAGRSRWATKRDSAPNVDGGVDRGTLPDAAVTKDITTTSPDPAGLVPFNLQGQQHPHADKGVKDCPACGAGYHADSKLRKCEKCGAKLPKADKTGKVDVTKGDNPDGTSTGDGAATKGKKKKGKPFPGAAEPLGGGKDTDGNTDGDDAKVDKSAAPYTVTRMHDALCAAYPWDTVTAEYPSLKGVGDAIAPDYFTDQVAAAVTKGDMSTVAVLAGYAQAATELHAGHVEAEKLADARAFIHKSFTDMYPAEHPTPSEVTPGRFQRPYVSAGHAPLNALTGRPANIPPATNVPDPDDFNRGYLTAGHATQSPSNKGDNLDTGGSLASGAARTFYRNASKEAARTAMQAMHDHIATTFPDLCPMAASKAVMPPDMGDTNRPHPVTPPTPAPVPGETTKTAKTKGLGKKQVRELIKSAVAETTKTLGDTYEQKIAALQATVDELGAQPDPTQAPLRGVVRKAATTDEPVPAPRVSLVEAAQAQAAKNRGDEAEFLAKFLNHPNPAMREQAEDSMRRLLATT